MMTLLDEYSRQSLAIQVERQITGAEVLRVVEQTMSSMEYLAIFVVTMVLNSLRLQFNNG